MTEPNRRPFVAGAWRETGDIHDVKSPATGAIVARVHRATPGDVEDAIVAAQGAFEQMRALATWERSAILEKIAEGLRRRHDELARILAQEAGKPLKAGRTEVDRAIFTFRLAAQETLRIGSELFPMDWAPWGADRIGIVRRFPLGPIAGITPFNFPLNLSAHKIAPCIASGNTMVIKPASQTPSATLVIAEEAQAAGLPSGALSVLPASTEVARPLVTDDRFRMLTFTGSAAVGWQLKRDAGKKRVALELGGNAAVIVHHDADLARAAERITAGGYGYAGQSCISVQRVLVHRLVQDRFMSEFVPRVQALVVGDPEDETTDIGPMISESEAVRAQAWIEEALGAGARQVVGGARRGALHPPVILTHVAPGMKVSCQEIFAPVVVVTPYDDLEEAFSMVNDSPYGLQAGLFTRDAPTIWRAFDRLEVGGLMVDDVSTFRMDHMPYGGVKDSGTGREGVKYAIEEMTELKVMSWHIKEKT